MLTLASLAAVPAHADVKAGVDAWTAGDFAGAVREWAGPAAQGDPDAQFNMGQAYRLGRGVETDVEQAEALYAKAAAQGHVKAADNYGLLLFQRGAREEALPYISAASMRGDPRAQYLLGIAHFNGDLVKKDWRRAYALLTLANSSGLPQARGALAQMDQYISIEDRQAAQPLAASLKAEAEAARSRQLAAADLGLATDAPSGPVVTASAPQTAATRPVVLPPATAEAPAPQTAGADYTLPAAPAPTVVARQEDEALSREVVAVAASPAVPPAVSSAPAAVPSSTPTRTSATRVAPAATGPWKVQLGAFGVPGNAQRLWGQLAGRSEIAGREQILLKSGNLTRLLAAGYATRGEAAAACASLKRSGQECLVTR
ncbi:SPOR domain-containing protein [Qipengyuania citrea]|nr:SPOR domain-containing protein [Qipengyuania citrea]